MRLDFLTGMDFPRITFQVLNSQAWLNIFRLSLRNLMFSMWFKPMSPLYIVDFEEAVDLVCDLSSFSHLNLSLPS